MKTAIRLSKAELAKALKPNKYNAAKTRCGEPSHGFHDSNAEAVRCSQLQLMVKGKLIRDLECHPKFKLIVNSNLVGTYEADWRYYDRQTGEVVVEDFKGMKSGSAYQMFALKKKLMKAIWGIEVRETSYAERSLSKKA